MAQFDLGDIFRQAFGFNPPTDASKINLLKAPDRREQSKLGQPFYSNTQEDIAGREFFLPVYLAGQLIPFAVLGMTWKKTYVTTSMPERGGSVKELISIDDYQFNVKGILINETNDFPDDGVMQLADMFRLNESITMRSVLSDIVLSGQSNFNNDDPNGHRVIIKEINWPEVTGIEHAKPFEMILESDLIFDLEIA